MVAIFAVAVRNDLVDAGANVAVTSTREPSKQSWHQSLAGQPNTGYQFPRATQHT